MLKKVHPMTRRRTQRPFFNSVRMNWLRLAFITAVTCSSVWSLSRVLLITLMLASPVTECALCRTNLQPIDYGSVEIFRTCCEVREKYISELVDISFWNIFLVLMLALFWGIREWTVFRKLKRHIPFDTKRCVMTQR
jgi:hypothetical protein